jgi:putative membrane protein
MIKAIIIGVVALFVILFIGSIVSIFFWILGIPMPWMMGMMGVGWGLMFLVPLFFLVLLALGLYYLFTGLSRTGRSFIREHEDALEILKRRYAKGEITTEQYLKMKEELK